MSSDALFGELRSLLLPSGVGTALGWGRLCALVERFEPERFGAQVLPYVLVHRDRFPEHLRFIPRRWLEDPATWPLARIADALLIDQGNVEGATRYLMASQPLHIKLLILHLPLNKVSDDALDRALEQELPHAQGLATVERLFVLSWRWSNTTALAALLRSACFRSLEHVVARGMPEGDWLPEALANHGTLRDVDIGVRVTGRVDSLPWSVRGLRLEHCQGDLAESLPWFGAAAPSFEELRLWDEGAATISDQIESVYHRLEGLRRLDLPTHELFTLLGHEPLARAWADGLSTVVTRDVGYVISPQEAALLVQLSGLERFSSAGFERWQDVVTLMAQCPALRFLSLRGTWCVALVQALEAQGLSERLVSLNIRDVTQAQLDALYAMDPTRWPLLRGLSLGWDILDALDLSRIALLPQLESLSVAATHSSELFEVSLAAAIFDGTFKALRALMICLPMSGELGEVVSEASWPELQALYLNCEDYGDLLRRLGENPSLNKLRLLSFSDPERSWERSSAQAQLNAVFRDDRLPALEFITLEDRVVERALLDYPARSEWMLANRMMYWFYLDRPELLGLVDLFGDV